MFTRKYLRRSIGAGPRPRHALLALALALALAASARAQAPAWRGGGAASQSESETAGQDVPTVDMNMPKQNLETVIGILADSAQRTIILGENLRQQQVNAFFKSTPVDEALESLVAGLGLCMVERGESLLIISRSEYLQNYAESEVVALRHANPSALAAILTGGGPGGGHGVSAGGDLLVASADPRTRSLVLTGEPEQIARARDLAMRLDGSLTSRVFSIRYASVNSVARAIREALYESALPMGQTGDGTSGAGRDALGTLVVDERSNRLIVHENAENLAICESIIESIDIPVETRVFATGQIDPKVIADQIRKGELGGANQGEGGRRSQAIDSEATVQVVEGTNQIIVTDTPERLDILASVMTELNRNIETRVLRPRHATPSAMSEIIGAAHPDVQIAVDSRTGSLVVTAHRDRLDQVEDLVERLDAEENIQVEIAASIMLVSAEKLKEYGVRYFSEDLDGLNEKLAEIRFNPNFGADAAKSLGSAMGTPPGASLANPEKSTGNFLEAFQPQFEMQAVIRALESDGDTQVLSNPRLRMLTGETSTIFSGSKEPYREVTLQNEQSVENVEFEEVGITFEVTPYVSPKDTLTIEVMTSFSSLREIRDGIPVVDTRQLDSTVSSRDGETVFLGGIISQESGKSRGGIPLLRDIPYLGVLFGSKRNHTVERELVIAMTSGILRETTQPFAGGLGDAVGERFPGVTGAFSDDGASILGPEDVEDAEGGG